MAPVTMSDVARVAGVSVMTVSNVVNGRPRVSAETRLRVLEVVADLGYEVNLTAKRLRAGRTGTVALVVPRFDHPYFGELAGRFATLLGEKGLHLAVEQSGASREGELSAVSHARLHMYDGVILSVVGLHYDDVDRLRTDLPIVLLGEQVVPERFDHVMMANVEGARLATAHLLERGSRRVAMAGGTPSGPSTGASELRSEGWRAAHRDAGLEPPEDLLVPMPDLEAATAHRVVAEALARARERGALPDAVFAVTDQVSLGVRAALHDAGLRVPQDVRLIGFDDLGLVQHVPPGLSSVDPHNGWIVERATDLLLSRIAGSTEPPQHLVAPASIAARASTA
ncbi:LacI family DNA-binding transcriptional regulator [Miniimonas arenae]|nr:LacI family DNA-binding transcriptional regulator [Miniimonas arenae]